MKNNRQREILELIHDHAVSSQDMLRTLLQKRGYAVTQATISRDIRNLNLVKRSDGNGVYRYVQQGAPAPHTDMFSGNILSVDHASNTVVIKCRSGTAQAVCTVLDSDPEPDIVGTLAGDDTIFVLIRTSRQAKQFAAELMQKIQDR